MKKDKRIDTIERLEDDDHVFYEAWLKIGWCWEDQGLHVLHEDTKGDILKNTWMIQKCTCKECK